MNALQSQVSKLPASPGVYLFRSASGRVLYVGKAKSIRKRVGSYFTKVLAGGAGQRLSELLGKAVHIDFVVVDTEQEALLVEANFIKHHRPSFNVRLRDDKSYPYIAISDSEPFPRVYFTRRERKPGTSYFGPYANAAKVRETLDLLGRLFPYRKCQGPKPGRPGGAPCLNYHIGRSAAPCANYIGQEEYRDLIGQVKSFLQGRYRPLERELRAQMTRAAAQQHYEAAAALRKRWEAVGHIAEQRAAALKGRSHSDFIGLALRENEAAVQIFEVRSGELCARHSFLLENTAGESPLDVVTQFALLYYSEEAPPPPILYVDIPDSETTLAGLSSVLSKAVGRTLTLCRPQRGEKLRLMKLATKNAQLALENEAGIQAARRSGRVAGLQALMEALDLPDLPMRLECYDISNLGESHMVGSMVVFEGGVPRKAHYRKFQIKSVEGQNDFAAMAEVIRRRFSRASATIKAQSVISERNGGEQEKATPSDESFAVLPDLIVIDGGKGQLSAAVGALSELGITLIPAVGLAKREEEIIRLGVSEPLRLPADSPALKLLMRLRDEAHRFAVGYHRTRRDTAMTASLFDALTGVGPTRKKSLLAYFGTPQRFLGASREELAAVPGLPKRVALSIYEQLHKTG